jgi:hypothetical protein
VTKSYPKTIIRGLASGCATAAGVNKYVTVVFQALVCYKKKRTLKRLARSGADKHNLSCSLVKLTMRWRKYLGAQNQEGVDTASKSL